MNFPAPIGRNIRKGMTPGGFSTPMNGSKTVIAGRKKSALGADHKEIKDAARALLEGRHLPQGFQY